MLIATIALAACSSSHGRDGGEDGGTLPADASVDTGPPPGVCPPAHASSRQRAVSACQPPDGIAAGRPFDLDVSLGECFCGEVFVCDASIVGPQQVAIETTVCTPGATCDACGEGRVRCAMPALGVGTWRVTMNGEPAFELDVRRGGEAPSPTCWSVAPPVDDGLECDFPGESIARAMPYVCHPDVAWPGSRATVRVVNPCAGCFALPGPCRATVEGNMLFLDAAERTCRCDACGDCPAVCMEGSVQCTTPPLTAGVYDVVLGGNVVSRLTVAEGGSGAEVCAGTSSGVGP